MKTLKYGVYKNSTLKRRNTNRTFYCRTVRDVFRILSEVYDGACFRKQVSGFELVSQKAPLQMLWGVPNYAFLHTNLFVGLGEQYYFYFLPNDTNEKIRESHRNWAFWQKWSKPKQTLPRKWQCLFSKCKYFIQWSLL